MTPTPDTDELTALREENARLRRTVAEYEGAHEPGCGLVPVLDLSTVPGWAGTAEGEKSVQAVAKEMWERTRDPLVVQTVEAAVRKALKVR